MVYRQNMLQSVLLAATIRNYNLLTVYTVTGKLSKLDAGIGENAHGEMHVYCQCGCV